MEQLYNKERKPLQENLFPYNDNNMLSTFYYSSLYKDTLDLNKDE